LRLEANYVLCGGSCTAGGYIKALNVDIVGIICARLFNLQKNLTPNFARLYGLAGTV